MNLYIVSDTGYDWGAYVFSETPNKAKMAVSEELDVPYIDLRCTTVKKDTGGEAAVCDENCDRLRGFGVEYKDDE